MTELFYGKEARKKLKKGIDMVADAVKVTLGGRGRNVSISKERGKVPLITKDGVTVANSIQQLSDNIENDGAQLAKDVAQRMMRICGDGTTTSTLLLQVMIEEGIKVIDAGYNPMDIKSGIDKAVACVVKSIKDQSIHINDNKELIEQIAITSANNDIETGKIVSDAMAAVNNGMILIEEGTSNETTIEVIEGMQIGRGYISPYFVTNPEKMFVEYINPYILIYDKKLNLLKEIQAFLELIIKTKRPLLVIAEDIEGEVLNVLVSNKQVNNYPFCAIKMPFGTNRNDIIEDIAAITGGIVVSEQKGFSLKSLSLDKLGTCEKLIVSKDTTNIFNGKGNKENIDHRLNNVKSQIQDCKNEFEVQMLLKPRLANIIGCRGIISVGGKSEVEMKERKDRIDDALKATYAAIEEGIIPGGGKAYLNSILSLTDIKINNDDELEGIKIISKALEAPITQILLNAGLDPKEIIKQINNGGNDYSYNVKSNKYENLLETKIIDPAKVARVALENAASVASMLLTTECAITDKQ
jgi:chaperonin GroEL